MEKWLRINGKVEWLEDKAIKEKIISISPLVATIYKNADNPILKSLYVKDATANLIDLKVNFPGVIKLC